MEGFFMAGGRPTKYKPEYCEQATKLCLLGAIDEKLADFFEVSVSTLNEWKSRYPEFQEAIKSGRELADARVADSLYNRAMGYVTKEVKVFNNHGEIIEKEVKKYYPPDSTAAIFWLKNRQKEQWREKQEISSTNHTTINQDDSWKVEFINAEPKEEDKE